MAQQTFKRESNDNHFLFETAQPPVWMHTHAHTLRHALTIRAPGFHRHAEVSCLDLATIHWNGRVLTHETRHYVGAAWAER